MSYGRLFCHFQMMKLLKPFINAESTRRFSKNVGRRILSLLVVLTFKVEQTRKNYENYIELKKRRDKLLVCSSRATDVVNCWPRTTS